MALKLIANMFAQDRLRGLMIKEKLQIIPVLELAVADADPKIKEDAVVVLLKYEKLYMLMPLCHLFPDSPTIVLLHLSCS
jgi:hypothetical protein